MKSKFQPFVAILPKEKRIQIVLEDGEHYGEWIKGEDGDVAIYKSLLDNHIVGAFLPLNKKWKGKLKVCSF